MIRPLLFALFLSGCFGGGGGPSAPDPQPKPAPPARALPVLGLGTHSMAGEARAELHALGVRYVRHTLYAPLWEDSAYREQLRADVAATKAEGFHLLLVAHPMPEGWTPERFAEWIGERAAELEVEAWQIGNEIPFPEHARTHELAYRAIKAAAPEASVVSIALPDETFARAFLETGVPFDALAVHTYGYPVRTAVGRWAHLTRGREVWITEFGLEPRVLPPGWTGEWELEQAAQWREATREAGRLGYARAYGYQLRTQEPLEMHGIVRPDGTFRPAALWLRSMLRP